MRTTLTLEDSLAAKLRAVARKQNRSFKQVLNDALRRGLETAEEPIKLKKFRVEPIMSGGFQPGVDMDKINQFLDDEEIDRFAAKMKKRK